MKKPFRAKPVRSCGLGLRFTFFTGDFWKFARNGYKDYGISFHFVGARYI